MRFTRVHRRLLASIAAVAVVSGLVPAARPALAGPDGDPQRLRIYVLSIDSLMRHEVDLMPTLARLKGEGVFYEDAWGVMIAETMPNHVAMMTGVVPARSGITGNFIRPKPKDAEEPCDAVVSDPALLQGDHLFSRIERERSDDVHTATFIGWTPLVGMLAAHGDRATADFHWGRAEPDPLPRPPTPTPDDTVRDSVVMDRFLAWLADNAASTPHFAFVHLVDVDNSGHGDFTGAVDPQARFAALRRSQLANADVQVRRLRDFLEATGAWEHTILFVVSDHGMDFSPAGNVVDLAASFTAAGFAGFRVTGHGGAAAVHLDDPSAADAVANWIRGNIDAVGFVLTANGFPSLGTYGLDHKNAGDVVVSLKAGWRFSDCIPGEIWIPGNHGHAPTQPTVLLVTGGHPALAAPAVVPPHPLHAPPRQRGQVGNLSIAPTVAALLDLDPPAGGWDGRMLRKAFRPGALARRRTRSVW